MLALLLLCSSALSANAFASHSLPCKENNVTVSSSERAEAHEACEAAEKAIVFMAGYGFDTAVRIAISVVDAPVELHDREVAGRFDARDFRITVPGFDHCCDMAQRRPILRMPMSKGLWQSFVAHEVAHAVAHENFRMERPPLVSHEYIAYVVQLATMPPQLRSELLSRFDYKAFSNEREISPTFLGLDPEVFAVKAYRHFLRLENKELFLSRLRSGEFRPITRY